MSGSSSEPRSAETWGFATGSDPRRDKTGDFTDGKYFDPSNPGKIVDAGKIRAQSKEFRKRITEATNLTSRTRNELLTEIKRLEGENYMRADLVGFNEGAQDLAKRLKQAIDSEGIYGSRQGIKENVRNRRQFLGRRQTVATRGEGITSMSANTLTGRK